MTQERLKTIGENGGAPIEDLNAEYEKLVTAGWKKETIWVENEGVQVPVHFYLSPINEDTPPEEALWILGGIHGREKEAPNAMAQSVDNLIEMARLGPPILAGPLLNKVGYENNWQYFNGDYEDTQKGLSVTDAEHVLPDSADPTKMRQPEASNLFTKAIIEKMLELKDRYPPKLVLNLHGDQYLANNDNQTYGYVCGSKEVLGDFCLAATDILKINNLAVEADGIYGEGADKFEIWNGFCWNWDDGSVDVFLNMILGAQVVVVEVSSDGDKHGFQNRIKAIKEILQIVPDHFWKIIEAMREATSASTLVDQELVLRRGEI